MNSIIQNKILELKKMASQSSRNTTHNRHNATSGDSLSNVIRSKKDAETFMSELETAIKRAK